LFNFLCVHTLEQDTEGQSPHHTLLLIFVPHFSSCIQQPQTLNRVQYSANRDGFINDEPGVWILVWPKPHSHIEFSRPFQMPACIRHTWDSLPAPF